MPEAITSVYIQALTGLHPGSGTALGVVDLPVQRERHTHWPIIPASSLKGVLRAASRPNDQGDRDAWMAVFGPETAQASDHAGALALTDARILAFPVRSLLGVFAWVTCPAVLDRFRRDWGLAGQTDLPAVPSVPDPGTVMCAPDSPLLIPGGSQMILEEFDFKRIEQDVTGWADALAGAVDADTRTRLRAHLAILPDDDFGHFVENATEVVARIGLDSKTKTVKTGALFYEEVLPPETLFHALVIAEPSRREGLDLNAAGVLRWLRDRRLEVVQIGADETIGRGFCRLTWAGEDA